MKRLKVLVACEFSGTVRDAFARHGHDSWSCDLLPATGRHIQGDVRSILADGWDLLIGHPPCTYLCNSGLHWNNRGRGWDESLKALDFVRTLMDAPIEHIAIENPVGIISRIRKPDQTIQPYQFGHDASKATCLWLKNLPVLVPTQYYPPRLVGRLPRWGNQTDSGQNRVPPSADRWAIRSLTYQGVADAMAQQWSQPARQQRLFA